MDDFTTWLQRRRKLESADSFDPSAQFKFGSGDVAGDYEHDLNDLMKTVMAKYQSEFTDWLSELASERNDTEIQDLLSRVQTDSGPNHDFSNFKDNSKKPEIVAPRADRANDPNSE